MKNTLQPVLKNPALPPLIVGALLVFVRFNPTAPSAAQRGGGRGFSGGGPSFSGGRSFSGGGHSFSGGRSFSGGGHSFSGGRGFSGGGHYFSGGRGFSRGGRDFARA